MRGEADVRVAASSAHAIGVVEAQTCFVSSGLETCASSMQHGEPGVCTGRARSFVVVRVAQHDPVAAFAVFEPPPETSWHNTPARLADDDATALTMQ